MIDIQLECVDCIEGMEKLDRNSIDCIITSPPYNLNINYGTYEDDLPRDSYLKWLGDVFGAMKQVLKPDDGHLFLNMGYSNIDPWIGMDVANTARSHFVLQNHINWVKSVAVPGKDQIPIPVGNFKPINSPRFISPTWEHIFHFTLSGSASINRLAIGVPHKDPGSNDPFKRARGRYAKSLGYENWWDFMKSATDEHHELMNAKLKELRQEQINQSGQGGQTGQMNKRCPGNTWFIPYEPINDRELARGGHPATFPVELAKKCILLALGEKGEQNGNGVVLDPFMGTGTTALAAQELGYDCIGFDIDPDYISFARKRLGI